MQAYSRIGAFVGFAWVMDTKLCWMLVNAEECGLTGQRPATGRVQLWCYWRWDRKSYWLFIYFLQGTVVIIHWFLYYQDYGSACEALFDGFKLDPENADIEHALRYPFFLWIIWHACFSASHRFMLKTNITWFALIWQSCEHNILLTGTPFVVSLSGFGTPSAWFHRLLPIC